MPFESKAQLKKCFAMKGRGQTSGWNCSEWAHKTKSIKSLPEHKKIASTHNNSIEWILEKIAIKLFDPKRYPKISTDVLEAQQTSEMLAGSVARRVENVAQKRGNKPIEKIAAEPTTLEQGTVKKSIKDISKTEQAITKTYQESKSKKGFSAIRAVKAVSRLTAAKARDPLVSKGARILKKYRSNYTFTPSDSIIAVNRGKALHDSLSTYNPKLTKVINTISMKLKNKPSKQAFSEASVLKSKGKAFTRSLSRPALASRRRSKISYY